MFSAWRRVDRNARRVAENQGFDGDRRLESLVTMGAFVKQSVAARKSEVLEEGVVLGF